ncbi:5-carboxymethyl-2-hydroxymuconate isomerase [Vibrio ruber]|uniref:Uncharacterized protein n=1 Tax=Vibrio ruber (strain DSM 16370 / JCM 11486 / BCRC 17186 / CECT 7878 / LMG 23124 / VR1) TaxID=1123498 RepID=A0A1R4LLW3_VIBR1|nr:hypothetical protein [Vibrio ruber]WNJ96414.1 5-carboxymethyl-2-hydroxymuconate isomerase [Vibrio ruber]SJN57443.1 hypothetical protein VR7878_02317 [Vibrio ruber DSM 16370]
MINLRMEYSAPVDERVNTSRLLEDLHQVLLHDETILQLGLSVKSNAIRSHQWFVGEQLDTADFIQLIVEVGQEYVADIRHSVIGKLTERFAQDADKIENLSVFLRVIEQHYIRCRS